MSTAREALTRGIRTVPHGAFGDPPDAYERAADAGIDEMRAAGFVVLPVADARQLLNAAERMAGYTGLGIDDDEYGACKRTEEAIRGS